MGRRLEEGRQAAFPACALNSRIFAMRKWNLNAFTRLAAVALLFLEPVYVNAQALQIADVKVRLFFQYSGELSTPLTGKDELWNIMAGGGGFSEPANSAFVDVTVSGVPKTYVAKQAVDLVVTNKRTGKIVDRQRGKTGIFGPSGETHVGFWLRSVSCDHIVLVASATGSSKSLTLPFRCGE
jgi:hypothetical protein